MLRLQASQARHALSPIICQYRLGRINGGYAFKTIQSIATAARVRTLLKASLFSVAGSRQFPWPQVRWTGSHGQETPNGGIGTGRALGLRLTRFTTFQSM